MKTKKVALAVLFITLVISNYRVNGQIDFNKLDQKGSKNGLWKGIYQDTKNPKYEGTFDHGKEVGLFSFFDNTKVKTVIATREFNPKDNSCYTIFYDQNKNVVSEVKIVNKQFDGLWKYFHQASKMIMTTENYKAGKLDGLRKVYYLSGKIAEETNFKNNLKEGIYKNYSENGIVLEESNFKNNEYNGLAIFRNTDGEIVSKGYFLNGKKTGIWEFFEKGKTTRKTNMSFPEKSTKTIDIK